MNEDAPSLALAPAIASLRDRIHRCVFEGRALTVTSVDVVALENIVKLARDHSEDAQRLAGENYELDLKHVMALRALDVEMDRHRLMREAIDQVATLWAGECQYGFGLDQFDKAIERLTKVGSHGTQPLSDSERVGTERSAQGLSPQSDVEGTEPRLPVSGAAQKGDE